MVQKLMQRKRIDVMDIVCVVFLTLFAALIFFPFYTTLTTSIVSASSYSQNPVQVIPRDVTLDNYRTILSNSSLWRGYANTLMIAGIGTLYALFVSVTMAYGLSFKNYPGKKIIFVGMVITMYFGGGMLPTYLQLKNMGLINTRLAIILLCGVSPFNIIIIKNNIDQLPSELKEAARIDGANEIVLFVKVVLPLIKSALATFALFIAVGYWNEWFWSALMLNKTDLKTLQLVLRTIIDQSSNTEGQTLSAAGAQSIFSNFSQGVKTASVICVMLPIMLLYPFLQKYFASGMLVGAIKM